MFFQREKLRNIKALQKAIDEVKNKSLDKEQNSKANSGEYIKIKN